MGSAQPYTPEKLVVGALVADAALVSALCAALEAELGPLDYRSPLLPFPYTTYYEAEMGEGLLRCFFTLSGLVDPSRLAAFKVLTNALEARFALDGRRRVNLDPGTLSLSRFVLASTKDSSHRVPVGQGIYVEVTLVYEHGGFRPVEWTYPDYASDAYRQILREIRERYVAELRSLPSRRQR